MSAVPIVWIVDDERPVREIFRITLVRAGYQVAVCADGKTALERIAPGLPGVVVLDVDLPGLSGWETLMELRRRGCTQPVLMISNINDVPSRVRGLDIGADDYIGKPCALPELVARVQALLRRAPRQAGAAGVRLGFDDIVIDLEGKVATKAGAPLRLTRTDYAVLAVLHENRGKPVARETILDRVWEGQNSSSHALDTHLWRLRKKLGDSGDEPRWIRNVPGIGYVMVAEGSEGGAGI